MYYFENLVGCGRLLSWEACKEDAVRRDSLWALRKPALAALPAAEKQRLEGMSCKPRDDSVGEKPGSDRGDEEERLFMATLSEEDRYFLDGHKVGSPSVDPVYNRPTA